MKIYDGGSDKGTHFLPTFISGNSIPPTIYSEGNQLFLSFTSNGINGLGKGFSASFVFGKKVTFFELLDDRYALFLF